MLRFKIFIPWALRSSFKEANHKPDGQLTQKKNGNEGSKSSRAIFYKKINYFLNFVILKQYKIKKKLKYFLWIIVQFQGYCNKSGYIKTLRVIQYVWVFFGTLFKIITYM